MYIQLFIFCDILLFIIYPVLSRYIQLNMHSYSTAYPLISRYLSYIIHWYPDNYPFKSFHVFILSIYLLLFYPVKYPSLYLFFIQTNPAIHALIYPTAYPLISWHLSYLIHWYPATYPFVSCDLSFLIRQYPDFKSIHIPFYSLTSRHWSCWKLDLVFGFSGLQWCPPWSGPSLACPAHQWGKPLCFISQPPSAATTGTQAISGTGYGPLQQWHWFASFAAPAPHTGGVCGILCWHQYTNKKLVLISTIAV